MLSGDVTKDELRAATLRTAAVRNMSHPVPLPGIALTLGLNYYCVPCHRTHTLPFLTLHVHSCTRKCNPHTHTHTHTHIHTQMWSARIPSSHTRTHVSGIGSTDALVVR